MVETVNNGWNDMIKRIVAILLIAPFVCAMEDQNDLDSRLLNAIKENDVKLVQEIFDLEQGAKANACYDNIIYGLASVLF